MTRPFFSETSGIGLRWRREDITLILWLFELAGKWLVEIERLSKEISWICKEAWRGFKLWIFSAADFSASRSSKHQSNLISTRKVFHPLCNKWAASFAQFAWGCLMWFAEGTEFFLMFIRATSNGRDFLFLWPHTHTHTHTHTHWAAQSVKRPPSSWACRQSSRKRAHHKIKTTQKHCKTQKNTIFCFRFWAIFPSYQRILFGNKTKNLPWLARALAAMAADKEARLRLTEPNSQHSLSIFNVFFFENKLFQTRSLAL